VALRWPIQAVATVPNLARNGDARVGCVLQVFTIRVAHNIGQLRAQSVHGTAFFSGLKLQVVRVRHKAMAVKAGGLTDGVKGFDQGFIEAHGFLHDPCIPLCPSWAGGGTGSVRVSGMQTSTTKRPDALKAQEHGLKVLECGGFQCRPVVRATAPKKTVWGGSSTPKFGENRACLVSAVDHENSVKIAIS
jgi:hypothetical protein